MQGRRGREGAAGLPGVSRTGLVVRGLVTLVLTAAVVLGTAIGNDTWWPFAPMSQYAFLVKNDGVINSPYMEARTVDGDLVGVALSKTGLGLERAEIEGQLPLLMREPQRMQAIAILRARRQPAQPRYAEIFLRNRQTLLGSGRTTRVIDLAHWVVVDPQNPQSHEPSADR